MRASRYLTYDERLVIERMFQKKATQKEIASVLGVSQQAISKELKRGYYIHTGTYKDYRSYSAQKAQSVIDCGKLNKGVECKIFGLDALSLDMLVYSIKKQRFSPFAALCALSDSLGYRPFSLNSLYKYISRGLIPGLCNADLPERSSRKKKKVHNEKRTKKQFGRSIEIRPFEVASRASFGHWEGDCVIGKKSGKHEVLLTLTERHSRFELIFKMNDKTSSSVCRILNYLSRNCDFPSIFQSITFDNGSEFSACKKMEFYKGKRRTNVFYAHPYSSWERGSNERHNRIIRRWFPKHNTLRGVSSADCARVAAWMNDYPRRVLGGRTPAQVLADCVPEGIYNQLMSLTA